MPKADQGLFQERYKVIPRCLLFIENEGGEVLLIKGHPDKRLWANKYNGIGGHIEIGEDILSAAERELFEETGLKFIDLWLCGNIIVDAGEETGISIFVFKGKYNGGEIVHSDEGELHWVSTAEVTGLPLVEDLFLLLPKVLAMSRGDDPFAAIYSYNESDELEIRFGNLD